MNDQSRKRDRIVRTEDALQTLVGAIFMLDALAEQGTEEAPALRLISRCVDDAFCELYQLAQEKALTGSEAAPAV